MRFNFRKHYSARTSLQGEIGVIIHERVLAPLQKRSKIGRYEAVVLYSDFCPLQFVSLNG